MLDYVRQDNYGIVREDLVLSIGERLNRMTGLLEEIGVPLPRDAEGNYIARSKRSIVMLGEHLKPLLARAVLLPACGLKTGRRFTGCFKQVMAASAGLPDSICAPEKWLWPMHRAVLIATGGASGIYRPSNPGLARTKTWYCPYNAGSGLAMGLRAGAEMTSFEMRFVALRTKDVIAPTGHAGAGGAHAAVQCPRREIYAAEGADAGPQAHNLRAIAVHYRRAPQGHGALLCGCEQPVGG